jgi:hypothetical protein
MSSILISAELFGFCVAFLLEGVGASSMMSSTLDTFTAFFGDGLEGVRGQSSILKGCKNSLMMLSMVMSLAIHGLHSERFAFEMY